MVQVVAWTLVLLVSGSFLPLVAAGEEPVEGACDPTNRLVCAAADAAGNVTCSFATPTSVQCAWSRGILWSGFSPLALPGHVEGSAEGFLEVCVDQDCTLETTPRTLPPCTWIAGTHCTDGQTASGSVGPIELAMGQCLKVTAGESVTLTARVIAPGPTIATASFSNAGEGAGQECVVDDGR